MGVNGSAVWVVAATMMAIQIPAIAQQHILRPSQAFYSLVNDVSPELRNLSVIPPQPRGERDREKAVPNQASPMLRDGDRHPLEDPFRGDPIAQREHGTEMFTVPLTNFEALSNLHFVAPPDPNIDVGPNHVVQTVNVSFAVYGKSGNLLYGPADMNTLWQGFSGPWTGTNDGDPIVLYDHLADRWLVSQFALPSYPNGPFYELVAISQTADPLGAWHRYAFSFTDMPDYPKFGVWPDGYYLSVALFTSGTLSFAGVGAAVLDRQSMLGGLPASGVMFTVPSGTGPVRILPSDLDGPTPPSGAPNYFAGIIDDAFGGGADRIEVYELHVDWTTPANSTYTGPTAIATSAFDMNLCGFSRNCLPQPGTAVGLDALSNRILHRLQYRNFGSYQTLVTNHTVDENGLDHAGVRWYELRNSGGGWTMYQQGTYAPDALHRWMGSVAMDGDGSIALGYSVTSGSTFPSIRYTGRVSTDPLGQMTLGEQSIISGTGSQTSTNSRWGDYTMMAVDPTDDNTFWYTNEYLAITEQNAWRTRVASFQFSNTTPQASLRYVSSTVSGGNGNGTIDTNECVNLQITLNNSGNATATSVGATLSTTTAGVTVNQALSGYPDISTAGSETNATPFQLSISPGFVCGTTIICTLAVSYSGSPSENLIVALPSCECTGTSVSGSLVSGDLTQTQRLTRDNTHSTCAAPKVCPGTAGVAGNRFYDAYTYTNTHSSSVCVNVKVISGCGASIFSAAYLGSYNGTSVCTNYLADAGARGEMMNYSFTLGAGATCVVVVHVNDPGLTCASYTLDVSGLVCTSDGGGPCAPLPVQLVSFTGTPQPSGDVLLEWRTLSEINNYGFEVEKKRMGAVTYVPIPNSFVPGHGTTNTPHDYSYVDTAAEQGSWSYRLRQIDLDGTVHYTEGIVVNVLTEVGETRVPLRFDLALPYPNPFNPATTIGFDVPTQSAVALKIVDVLGREVSVLVNDERPPGRYRVRWNAEGFSSGVYFCTLRSGSYSAKQKLMLLR